MNPRQVSPASGWFWTVYSIGIGVAGSFIPSFTIQVVGEYGTLWLASSLLQPVLHWQCSA